MEYQLKVDTESEKEVEVLVPAAELSLFMEQETDRLRKDTAVKGFRKGRVPREIIKSKFKDTIKAQALNDLVTKYYIELLKEKKWQPAAPVQLMNIEEGDQIKFQIRLEIVPEFKVENYIGLEIIKEKPLPPEHLMNETLNNLRERAARIQEVKGQAAVDNFITLDLEISEKDQVKSSEKDVMIRIGDRNFPDEINRALVGVQKGQYKEARAGDQVYKMTIKKVEEKVLPTLDETFAKDLGFENLETLKKRLAEDLQKREEMRVEDEMKESIAQMLLERVRFNTPKSMINNEYQDILKRNNLPDSDATKERFWDMSEKRVRFNLILDKIAAQENITIDEPEIMSLIEHMGMKLDDDNRLDIIMYFRRIMMRQKTIEHLLKNGKISEKGRILSPKEASDANRTVRH